jgi:hypothetical protein
MSTKLKALILLLPWITAALGVMMYALDGRRWQEAIDLFALMWLVYSPFWTAVIMALSHIEGARKALEKLSEKE